MSKTVMGRRVGRWGLLFTCLLTAAGLALPRVAAAYCPPVEVIDSRGSGTSGISEPGGAFATALRHDLSFPVAVRGNPYPAVSVIGTIDQIKRATLGLTPAALLQAIADSLNGIGANLPARLHVGRYHDSVNEGELDLRRLVADVNKRCGDATALVLVGYSQGAQVTGDVYSGLSRQQRALVAGVVLFGDPRYRRTSYAAQGKRQHDGILHPREEFPADSNGKVLSYCHGRDVICQTYGSTGPHGTYASAGDAHDAAAKIAARIDLPESAAFELSVDGDHYRVGPYRTTFSFNTGRSMSLAGTADAFGSGDHCTLPHGTELWTTARWDLYGISGRYVTYGAYAQTNGNYDPHGNGCKYPAQIQVDSLFATGRYWHTAAGLRLGDPVSRITALYPGASLHPDGWWLASKAEPWDPTTPVGTLIVNTLADQVSGFTVYLGAEGD